MSYARNGRALAMNGLGFVNLTPKALTSIPAPIQQAVSQVQKAVTNPNTTKMVNTGTNTVMKQLQQQPTQNMSKPTAKPTTIAPKVSNLQVMPAASAAQPVITDPSSDVMPPPMAVEAEEEGMSTGMKVGIGLVAAAVIYAGVKSMK